MDKMAYPRTLNGDHTLRCHDFLNVKFQEVKLPDCRPFLEVHGTNHHDEEDGARSLGSQLRANDELLGIIEGPDKMNDEVTAVLDMGPSEFIEYVQESVKELEEFIMIFRRREKNPTNEARQFIYFKLTIQINHTASGYHEITRISWERLEASIVIDDGDKIWDIEPEPTSSTYYVQCAANGQYLTPYGLTEKEHQLFISSYHGHHGRTGEIENVVVIEDYERGYILEAFPRSKTVIFNPQTSSDGAVSLSNDTPAEEWMFKCMRIRKNVFCLESLKLKGYFVKVNGNKLILRKDVDFQDPEFQFEFYEVKKVMPHYREWPSSSYPNETVDKDIEEDIDGFEVMIKPEETKPVENGTTGTNNDSGPVETNHTKPDIVPGPIETEDTKSDIVLGPEETDDRTSGVKPRPVNTDEMVLSPLKPEDNLRIPKRSRLKACFSCCWTFLKKRNR
ncbi:uncharacterized protein LOC106164190 isoform X2 [Lingula anatina]|uniref:Uncharacterized protein LOC106164190 isoform X2 n=1 Tax=Lingula anatina TaxID=7574 RepID=A0A1S3IGW5_LINAN|nr:uncharacterized protein LOC106164190 isoform X2 [Lingula anatina]|eukprot:XP_013397457.1 uncharacterized protein LOC106164190 isoform X2 [Lingula anatina]